MEEAYHHAYEDRAGAALVIDGPLSEAKRVEGLQQEKNEGQNKEGSHRVIWPPGLYQPIAYILAFFLAYSSVTDTNVGPINQMLYYISRYSSPYKTVPANFKIY